MRTVERHTRAGGVASDSLTFLSEEAPAAGGTQEPRPVGLRYPRRAVRDCDAAGASRGRTARPP